MHRSAEGATIQEATIRSARFRAEREADWRRLDEIVTRTERGGVRQLSFDDARDLAVLYRQATNSLSVAREISLDKSLLDYLEVLCARGYLAVYAPQENLGGLLHRTLVYAIPDAMRRSALPLLLGFLAMILGGITGYMLFLEDNTWYNTFMPEGLAGGRGLTSSREDLLSVIYGGSDQAIDQLGAFAAYLFSHNTQIAIFAFALGVFVCLPSFALAMYNGMVLGVFLALHVDRGLGWDIVAWLSIHGVTEISAICIATAGGFRLGLAVLFPGKRRRRDALRETGRDACLLAILAAIMLLAAGLLEGFGRQLVQDLETRLIVGWGIGALWLGYVLYSGKETRARRQDIR
ncbi:MAG: stage II sporulation protein M [Pseudomonadota bacterium]